MTQQDNQHLHEVEPFLKCVARAYSSRFGLDGFPHADEVCFVFPNKRAGTFLLKYLRENTSKWMLAPEVTTISDFVADLSGRLVNNRIDLVFLLYNCYCEILDPNLPPAEREKLVSFDAFRKWGETVMRDFNEIDMQIADAGYKAEEIFNNIADFKNISSSFLTPGQRKVIEEYFGYHFSDKYDSQFWTSIDYKKPYDPEKPSMLRDKFIELWKILYPLYTLYHKRLRELDLISPGGVYREAADVLSTTIETGEFEKLRQLLPYKKLVMVGFNALSMAERQIFTNLSKIKSGDIDPEAPEPDQPFADFIWDATGPILYGDEENSAGRFVRLNRIKFPNPKWIEPYLEKSYTDSLPAKLQSIAAPSSVMQVKIATQLIRDLYLKEGDKLFSEARVALVVPDENLLLPLLYSLPEELKEVNLTMGYPLRLTAATSFLSLLKGIQLSRRDSKDYEAFNFQQLHDLLTHPLAHTIFPTGAINRFIRRMERQHIMAVKYPQDFIELRNAGPEIDGRKAIDILFHTLSKDASSDEVIRYLDGVLHLLEHVLHGISETEKRVEESEGKETLEANARLLKGNLELENVTTWREKLRCFKDSIGRYQVKLGVAATLTEAFRLVQSEIVPFEGKPLKGLQIMGMLETRSVDFDYLIIVGLNDRTIPGRMRQRTFIPNIIRMGYGMPPNTYQEDLFGYYFYRMISRAKEATFIYDSRITGFTGGVSRYLQQLRYIYAKKHLQHIDYQFKLSRRELLPTSISKKTPIVSSRLKEYISDSGTESERNFSASLLKNLTSCELIFYFKGILDLKDDPAPTPAINPVTEGTIVHNVMRDLYVPEKALQGKWLGGETPAEDHLRPVEITRQYLEWLLSDAGRDKIHTMVKDEIMKEFYHRPPGTPWITDSDIQSVVIRNEISDILAYDLRFAPFNIYGVEIDEIVAYSLPDGRRVRMRYIIDRIDDINEKDPRITDSSDREYPTIRVVDYKTGRSHITADDTDSLFRSNYNKDNLLQLLLYTLLLNIHREKQGLPQLNVRPRIYPVGRLAKHGISFYQLTRSSGKGEAGDFVRDDNDNDIVPKIGGFYIEDVGTPLPGDTKLMEKFQDNLDALLTKLFDLEQPFEGQTSIESCSRCLFYNICSSKGNGRRKIESESSNENIPEKN